MDHTSFGGCGIKLGSNQQRVAIQREARFGRQITGAVRNTSGICHTVIGRIRRNSLSQLPLSDSIRKEPTRVLPKQRSPNVAVGIGVGLPTVTDPSSMVGPRCIGDGTGKGAPSVECNGPCGC